MQAPLPRIKIIPLQALASLSSPSPGAGEPAASHHLCSCKLFLQTGDRAGFCPLILSVMLLNKLFLGRGTGDRSSSASVDNEHRCGRFVSCFSNLGFLSKVDRLNLATLLLEPFAVGRGRDGLSASLWLFGTPNFSVPAARPS